MAAASGLSAEEFGRLQEQLLQLRTENYDLQNKLKKSQTELTQEKETQKNNKGLKFSGFQVNRKSNKKDHEELQEENERISQQMQRQEEDFKLQNRTLLEELQRLAGEKEEAMQNVKKLEGQGQQQQSNTTDSEMIRLQAENNAFQITIAELRQSHDTEDGGTATEASSTQDEATCNELQDLIERIESQYGIISNKNPDEETDDDQNNINEFVTLSKNLCDMTIKLKGRLSQKQSLSFAGNTDLELQLRMEKEEKMLVLQQLTSDQEANQSKISELSKDNDQLKEKLKKKQESLVRLQQEMESQYKEHTSSITAHLTDKENAVGILTRKLENLEIEKNALLEKEALLNEVEGKLEISRAEQSTLQTELVSLRQEVAKLKEGDPEKLNKLVIEKEIQIQQLKEVEEGLNDCVAKQKQELDNLTEKVAILESAKHESEQIAEKRKMFLDALSTERQADATRHTDEIATLKRNNENEKSELQTQLSSLKKTKKELVIITEKFDEMQAENKSLDKKCSWLEQTLRETEQEAQHTNVNHTSTLNKLNEEHNNTLKQLNEEHSTILKELEDRCESLQNEITTRTSQCNELTQTLKDKDVEFSINFKKSDHLIRDLKRQLNSERKRTEHVQLRLQDFLSSSTPKSGDDYFAQSPESSSRGHRRQDSGSHLSVASSSSIDHTVEDLSYGGKSPVQSSAVNDETLDLISKVADLQQDKWKMEERVRHLEENGAVMAEDIMQKSAVIQSIVLDRRGTTPTRQDDPRRQQATLKDKMIDTLKLGKYDTLKEANSKLQRILEETLTKNVQLEKDLDLLSAQLVNKDKDNSEINNEQN